MKARKLFPIAILLLLLAATCLYLGLGSRPAASGPAPATAAQVKPAGKLPPVANAEIIPGLPSLRDKGIAAPTAPALASGPVTAVLAADGTDPSALAQAPASTTRLNFALKRIRPARINNLASLQGQPGEPGVTPSTRRFQFDLFPGLSLSATAHSLENLPLTDGDTLRGVYTGTIDNVPNSIFTLAYNNGAISASIAAGPFGNYVIQPAADGWYRVSEAKPNNPSYCGTLPKATTDKALGRLTDPSGDPESHMSDIVPVFKGPKAASLQSPVTVTALIIYTDDLKADYGGSDNNVNAVIDSQTAYANQAYVNSRIGLKLSIVKRMVVAYDETSSLSIDLQTVTFYDGILDDVHQIRDQFNADLVSFWVLENGDDGLLGIAYMPQGPDESFLGFSCVKPNYDFITFPHELGHNLGCDHNTEDATTGGRFPFSFGYRVEVNDVLYMDIMSYPPATGDFQYVQAFSNPDIEIFPGVPFGDDGIPGADNATTINEIAPETAAFRPKSTASLVSPPTNVKATDGTYPATVLVQWSPSTGASGYLVYRSNSNNSGSAVLIGSSDETSFEDISVNPGQQYYYFVKAVDFNNVPSGFSAGDAGKARAPALGTISSITASLNADTLYVRVNFGYVGTKDGYKIYRNLTPSLIGATVFTKPYDGEFLDYTADAGVVYYYWVQAFKGADVSSLAGPAQGSIKIPPAPGKVQSLGATTPFPRTHIALTWSATANAARYQLVRTTNPTLSPNFATLILETPYEGIRSFKDFTAEPGVNYYYYVRAINAGAAGLFSNRLTVKIPLDAVIEAPKNVKASRGTNTDRIIITWDAAPAANGYSVYRNTVNDTATAGVDSVVGSLNSREVYDIGLGLPDDKLQPNTDYYYWVRTRNAQGALGPFSNVGIGRIKTPPPTVPLNLVASNGLFLDYVKVTWEKPYGAAKVVVYRDQNAGNVNTKIGEVAGGVTAFFDTTAIPGTVYYYRVRAVNSENTTSDFSNVDSGFRQDPATLGPPLTPSSLLASNDRVAEIRVSWSGSQGASQYNVYRNNFNGPGGTLINTTEGTAFTDEDVLPEQSYYYSVVAENAGGTSSFSNVDEGEALLGDPDPDLTIDLSDFEIAVGAPFNTLVGTFRTLPIPALNPPSYVYTFEDGSGTSDEDNNLFTIQGNELRSAFIPTQEEEDDGEIKNIFVRSTDTSDPYRFAQQAFNIVIVPANARTASLTMNPQTGAMMLAWPELNGTYFQVQRNTSLSDTGWENIGGVTTGRAMSIDTASGVPNCYYRVVKITPVP